MKKLLAKFAFATALILLFGSLSQLGPTVVLADQDLAPITGGSLIAIDLKPSNPSVPYEADTDVQKIISNIVKYIAGIAGFVVVLFIIIGGVRLLASAGNQRQVESGKKIVTKAIIGGVVLLLVYTIVQTILVALSRGTL